MRVLFLLYISKKFDLPRTLFNSIYTHATRQTPYSTNSSPFPSQLAIGAPSLRFAIEAVYLRVSKNKNAQASSYRDAQRSFAQQFSTRMRDANMEISEKEQECRPRFTAPFNTRPEQWVVFSRYKWNMESLRYATISHDDVEIIRGRRQRLNAIWPLPRCSSNIFIIRGRLGVLAPDTVWLNRKWRWSSACIQFPLSG